MKSKLIRLISITLAVALAALGGPVPAQTTNSATGNGPTKTDSRILYHDGPVTRLRVSVLFARAVATMRRDALLPNRNTI